MTGPILRDTVTERCLPVIRGVAARGNVPHLELIFPVSIVIFRLHMYFRTLSTTFGIVRVQCSANKMLHHLHIECYEPAESSYS